MEAVNEKAIVSITDVGNVIPKDKPIVFWDTCFLIYIISIAMRNSFRDYDSYKQVLDWIENDEVVSVISEIVLSEFADHFEENKKCAIEDQKVIQRILKEYACTLDDHELAERISHDADNLDLVSLLVDIEKRVWAKTYVIKEDEAFARVAHYRVLHKMSPSATKDQYKDCYIWSTFISLCKQMPPEQFKVMLTENKLDYCVGKTTNLQTQIADDCENANANIVFNIGSLKGMLYKLFHPEN